ncbi:unnamed protein product [Lupinus luteus]|uniref:EF-hand domain-containing protein n=1 Tax=Lupinus luteus TaxID=3873 RepID=A0AAV1WTJ9_LUPLU
MAIKRILKPSKCLENGLIDVFHHFDRDGDGKISAFELRSYFGSIGEYMSHEEAQGVIHDFDYDGDNMLDFKEFTKLMKKEGNGHSDEDEGYEKSYDECVAMINAFDIDHNGVLDFNEFHQMMA